MAFVSNELPARLFLANASCSGIVVAISAALMQLSAPPWRTAMLPIRTLSAGFGYRWRIALRAVVAFAYEAVTAFVPYCITAMATRPRRTAPSRRAAAHSTTSHPVDSRMSSLGASTPQALTPQSVNAHASNPQVSGSQAKPTATWTRNLAVTAFGVCLFSVLWITGVGTLADLIRGGVVTGAGQVNLHPFSSSINWATWLLNVLLFVPLGFLLPCGWRGFDRAGRSLAFGFCLSLAIELSQLLNFRVTDVDDLIANTLGMLVGLAIYRLVRRIAMRACPRWWSRHLGRQSLLPTHCAVACSAAMFAGVFVLYASSRHAEMRIVSVLDQL